MFPDIKFAIKVDAININTIQSYVGNGSNDFFGGPLGFPWKNLKNCLPHACESEGYFTNHYNDKNIQSGNSIVMDV